MVNRTTRVLIGALHHIELHLTHAYHDGEVTSGSINTVGVEGNGALNATSRQSHAHKIKTHILVARGDEVDVYNLATMETVLDACTCLKVIGTFFEVTQAGAVVAR